LYTTRIFGVENAEEKVIIGTSLSEGIVTDEGPNWVDDMGVSQPKPASNRLDGGMEGFTDTTAENQTASQVSDVDLRGLVYNI